MSQFGSSRYISAGELQDTFVAAMRRVYLWMFFGLSLTAVVAFAVAGSPTLLGLVFSSSFTFYGLIIAELALVVAISAAIFRLHPLVGLALFFGYAALNGVTMAAIFLLYDLGTIGLAFVSAALFFAIMSVIGFTTRQDLSSWGKLLFIGIIGLLAASVVNVFLASSALDWILSYAGLGLFLALTIYDTQRIKNMTFESVAAGQTAVVMRMGVLGALRLYLDFVNTFLFLLRIFGRRR